MDAADKLTLATTLQDEIGRLIVAITHAARDAREAATHEEARPENDKDTRAVEAAYLAGAQADRVRELTRARATLGALTLRPFGPDEGVAAAALVALGHDDQTAWYFVAPEGGGMEATVGGERVRVISVQSALGQALLGRRRGDEVEVMVRGALRTYEVLRVV